MSNTQPQLKRIGWKQGKEEELLKFISEQCSKGVSIVEALKAFAKQNGISWTTARWKYYRLRHQQMAAQSGTTSGMTSSSGSSATFQELGRALCNLSNIRQTNIEAFAAGLAALTDMALSASKLAQKLACAEQTLKQVGTDLGGLAESLRMWENAPPGEKLSSIEQLVVHMEDCLSRLSSMVAVAQVDLKTTN